MGREPGNVTAALIPNAKDYYATRAKNFKSNDVSEYMQNLGISPTIVDLIDYDDPADIKHKLTQYDLVWVMGGNTFCLRHEMKRSGFDQIIKEVIQNGVVYGGDSAGAIVAGNSIRGIEYADEPEFAEEAHYDGLNLTPHFILPHTDSTMFGDAVEKARDMHRDDPTLITLTDTQALIIDGESEAIATGPLPYA
ncbi:MAG: peptidase [Candidatus Saccharibacteria bacterium]|nr:peptidase [Candidatus Saccharibacteria bacterium]